MKLTHNLIQGSDAWDQFRLDHFGASEAAAMLGLSKKVRRNDLLRMKKTGLAKVFADWVQKNVLDYGHHVEKLALKLLEKRLGQDFYPVTCSIGKLSASCDGLTLDDEIAFEHKQWNAVYAALIAAGEVPEEHMPQCQQILMVTGAKKLIFVMSDGTEDNMVSIEVLPDPAWFDRLRAGWAQFEVDLEAYVPESPAAEPVGRTPETLPALRIEVTGMVTASNLSAWKEHAFAVFAGINRELVTDQHFADAAKTVKWCGEVEDKLAAAKQHALSQTASIDDLFKTIDDISAEARRVRLELNKLVDAQKEKRRLDILQAGQKALADHVASLNVRIGKPYMPPVSADFAGAMKGKRTIESLQGAVDDTLAQARISTNATADRIQINLRHLDSAAADHLALFSDIASLVLKDPQDFEAQVQFRVADQREKEKKRAEELAEKDRERIRQEEQAKAEATVKAQRALEAAAAPAPAPSPVAAAPTPAPATTTAAVAPLRATTSTAPAAAPVAADAVPTLSIGQIGTRLGFTLPAAFLETLGFTPTRARGAVLFHEADWPRIKHALVEHIEALDLVAEAA